MQLPTHTSSIHCSRRRGNAWRSAMLTSFGVKVALAYGLITGVAHNAHAAAESRLAQQALHCSAIFSVFAESLTNDSKRLNEFKRGVEIFTDLYVKESEGEPTAAKRDAEQRRTALLNEFQQQIAQREPYLREDGVVCGAWAEAFFAQGERWTFVPVYPKVISISARQKYTPLGAEAFPRWRR